MHLILLSGGSGKRLWPLSNGVRAKQFLKLLRAKDGGLESMVQRVAGQLAGEHGDLFWSSVTVVAGGAQKDQLMMQLPPNINILIEPEPRDTFPAISYAVSWLFTERGVCPEETVVAMPVDPFVEPAYFERIALMEDELDATGAELILLGSKPTEPTEKFGYIVPDMTEKNSLVYSRRVLGFREKPPVRKAKELIEQGALWNCGIFGIKVGYILELLKDKYSFESFDTEYVTKAFFSLPKTSFDYAVVESTKNIRVIEYDGSWKDLGTWESFSEEIDAPVLGNVITDGACSGTHIINELDIPIVALGINNAVIVVSPDGILIADKSETYKLKEITAPISGRPMYEEKRWGEYQVLNHTVSDEGETLTKKLIIRKGKQISYQYHNHRSEVWTITHGKAILIIDGVKREIGVGETIAFNAGVKHGIFALDETELIETQFGMPLVEEDIVRLEMDWEPEIC